MPFGLTYQGPPDDEQDAAFQQAADLLQSLGISPGLEFEPPPQAPMPPPRIGAGRDIVGSIGDALLTMATVRAGGAPPAMGPFAAGRREQQKSYQERLMEFQKRQVENETANRTLRNTARMLGARQRPRQPIKSEINRDVGGVTHKVVQFFNPEDPTSPIGEYDMGPVGYAPAIVPGTVGGEEGIYRVPRAGGGLAQPVSAGGGREQLRPPAKPGVVEDISNIAGIMRNIDTIKSNPLIAPGGKGEFTGRLKQEAVRSIPLVGPQISSRMNPEVEGFEADLDNLRAKIQLILTGKAVNPQEIKRLLALVPAASTATNPKFFNTRIQRFEDEFKASMARQARLRPDLFTPDELLGLGETRSTATEAPEGETPEQKKARIKAKYGIP